ncbi:MAG: hypothetical protein ACT4PL_08150 [Phycisphaerales bacterium]
MTRGSEPRPGRNHPRLARLGLALLFICGLATAFSVWSMSRRVNDFYAAAPPAQVAMQPVTSRAFEPFGHPLALVDDRLPDGRSALRVEYAGRTLLLPVHPPKVRVADVPPEKAAKLDLGVYDEWVALLAFLPVREGSVVLEKGERFGRLVLVKRNTAPGYDDDMGGTVNRKRWTFDFLEFLPSGDLAPLRTLQFPSTDYRTGKPYLPALRDDPKSTVAPIEERSWEFQAALFAIPKLQIANYRFRTDAFAGTADVRGMGWTLPVAGFSIIGFMLGIVLTALGAGSRKPG